MHPLALVHERAGVVPAPPESVLLSVDEPALLQEFAVLAPHAQSPMNVPFANCPSSFFWPSRYQYSPEPSFTSPR